MLSLLLRNQLSTVCFYKGCVFFTLELVEPFSGHCLAIKRQNIPQSPLQVLHLAALLLVWAYAGSKLLMGLTVKQQS